MFDFQSPDDRTKRECTWQALLNTRTQEYDRVTIKTIERDFTNTVTGFVEVSRGRYTCNAIKTLFPDRKSAFEWAVSKIDELLEYGRKDFE